MKFIRGKLSLEHSSVDKTLFLATTYKFVTDDFRPLHFSLITARLRTSYAATWDNKYRR